MRIGRSTARSVLAAAGGAALAPVGCEPASASGATVTYQTVVWQGNLAPGTARPTPAS